MLDQEKRDEIINRVLNDFIRVEGGVGNKVSVYNINYLGVVLKSEFNNAEQSSDMLQQITKEHNNA